MTVLDNTSSQDSVFPEEIPEEAAAKIEREHIKDFFRWQLLEQRVKESESGIAYSGAGIEGSYKQLETMSEILKAQKLLVPDLAASKVSTSHFAFFNNPVTQSKDEVALDNKAENEKQQTEKSKPKKPQ